MTLTTTLSTAPTPSPEEIIARVEPVLRAYAPTAEAERRLAPEAITALIDAGVFRTWVPRAYGGLELDPIPALQMFEELSRIDSAAGWVAGNSAGIISVGHAFPDEASAEIAADPRTVMAGSSTPAGAAVPVDGGYCVTGRWPFGSGCTYANWLACFCLVMDGDAPRRQPDGSPAILIAIVPAEEAEILDNWHTLGMRGTGSFDFQAADVFVPAHRTAVLGPFDHKASGYSGPLYRFGLWLNITLLPATALGIARAALDDLLTLAAAKTPSYTQAVLADQPVVRDRVGRARALIDAGRAALYAAVDDAWRFVQAGGRITGDACIPLGLAVSFAMEAAVEAVDLVHAVAGTTAIRAEAPFEQHFRDVHTISQHAMASSARFASLGAMLLGRRSDWALYYV
ncbi:MAG: acyl-CoA dehydrogenase family protein [Dehalococcoidia bacterium]